MMTHMWLKWYVWLDFDVFTMDKFTSIFNSQMRCKIKFYLMKYCSNYNCVNIQFMLIMTVWVKFVLKKCKYFAIWIHFVLTSVSVLVICNVWDQYQWCCHYDLNVNVITISCSSFVMTWIQMRHSTSAVIRNLIETILLNRIEIITCRFGEKDQNIVYLGTNIDHFSIIMMQSEVKMKWKSHRTLFISLGSCRASFAEYKVTKTCTFRTIIHFSTTIFSLQDIKESFIFTFILHWIFSIFQLIRNLMEIVNISSEFLSKMIWISRFTNVIILKMNNYFAIHSEHW